MTKEAKFFLCNFYRVCVSSCGLLANRILELIFWR